MATIKGLRMVQTRGFGVKFGVRR